jgi:hypothetical protein
MNNLLKIKIACDILLEVGEFNSTQCIAILYWNAIPEAAVHVSTYIVKSARVSIYKLYSTKIVDIAGYGYFQIL